MLLGNNEEPAALESRRDLETTRNRALRLTPPSRHAQLQLSLFQSFYGPSSAHARMSNVIEIWDAAPKYATPSRRAEVTEHPAVFIERTFNFRGTLFQVTVAPALIKDSTGRNVYRFPTAREELIEDALRKIAVQQHLGFVGIQEAKPIIGVRFSLRMLRRELAKYGHSIKHTDLVESLMVLSGSLVMISYASRRTTLHRSPILSNLTAVSRDDYLKDPTALWEAHFHSMVAGSLSAVTYRQYDYEATMAYRSSLARWLHKYLAAAFINAGMAQPCKILLSEVVSNSGLLNHSRTRDRLRELENAFHELMNSASPILRSFDRSHVLDSRRIVDAIYLLNPSQAFVRLVIAANKRQSDGRTSLADMAHAPTR